MIWMATLDQKTISQQPFSSFFLGIPEEFLPYTPATSMRFLLAGELRYVRSSGSGVEEVTDEAQFDKDSAEKVMKKDEKVLCRGDVH